MKIIWITTTAVLFCASTFFSVQLLTELAETPKSALAYAAVAIALAMVQYAVLPRAINQWQQRKHISASTSFITWALLTLLSIAASAAALIGDTQNHQQAALSQSTEYQLLIGQIDQLQQQSNQLQNTAQIDTANGYRARAIEILDKNTAIQNNILELREKLSQLPPESYTAAGHLFAQLAARTGYSSDQVMTFAYLIVAILIELGLTVSVTALSHTDTTPSVSETAHKKPQTEFKPETFPGVLWANLISRLSRGQPVTSYA